MTTDNAFGALKDVQVSKQQDPKKEKQEIEMLRGQYESNDRKIAEMIDIFATVREAREDVVDDEMKELFDKSVETCHDILEVLDEVKFEASVVTGGQVIKKQKENIDKFEKEIQEMAELADVDIMYNDSNDKKELSEQTIKELLMNYDILSARVKDDYKENKSINDFVELVTKRMDRGVINMKESEKKRKLVHKLQKYIAETIPMIEERLRSADMDKELKSLKVDDVAYNTFIDQAKVEFVDNTEILTTLNRRNGFIEKEKDKLNKMKEVQRKKIAIEALQKNMTEATDAINKVITQEKLKSLKIDDAEYNALIKKIKEEYSDDDEILIIAKRRGKIIKQEKIKLNKIGDVQQKEDAVEILQKSIIETIEVLNAKNEANKVKQEKNNKKKTQKNTATKVADDDTTIDGGNIADKSDNKKANVINIEGVEKLNEEDAEIIQGIFVELKLDFADIDKADEVSVDYFWNNFVPNRIKEGNQLEDHSESIKKIIAVLKINFEQNKVFTQESIDEQIDAINDLNDAEKEAIKIVTIDLQARFQQIDKDDVQGSVMPFWQSVAEEITAKSSITGETLAKVMNTVMSSAGDQLINGWEGIVLFMHMSKDSAEQNNLEITEEINAIFDFAEMSMYAGEGKTKKSQENTKRIKEYKEDIIESIEEIEKVSGRTINRNQFALDYVQSKAKKIFKILEGHVSKQDNKEVQGDIQKTRDAADITFEQMKKYKTSAERLNADTVERGDEQFKQVTREVWREFAVRGFLNKNRETGELEITQYDEKIKKSLPTNTDCEVALYLLQKAGMNTKDVKYVAPGEYEPGRIHIDTGKEDGLVILDDGTVIIDHHGDESTSDTSGTEYTYDILTRLGLLEKTEPLNDLIEFVNQVDNFDYPDKERFFDSYFENSHKTLLGVYRNITPEKLLKFFKYGEEVGQKRKVVTEVLKPSLLKYFGVDEKENSRDRFTIMERQKTIVQRRFEALQIMKKDGFIIDSERYGKICVDIVNGKGFPKANNDSARAFGCDTYLSWNEADNDFFMSSLVGKSIEDKLAQGKNIRKTMWIKSKNSGEEIMQLKDVLEKMTDGKLKISEKLQKALDNNGERSGRVELTEKEIKKLNAYVIYAQESIKIINEMDYGQFGIEGEKIDVEKAKLFKLLWRRFRRDVTKGGKFNSIDTEGIVTLVKDKI